MGISVEWVVLFLFFFSLNNKYTHDTKLARARVRGGDVSSSRRGKK